MSIQVYVAKIEQFFRAQSQVQPGFLHYVYIKYNIFLALGSSTDLLESVFA